MTVLRQKETMQRLARTLLAIVAFVFSFCTVTKTMIIHDKRNGPCVPRLRVHTSPTLNFGQQYRLTAGSRSVSGIGKLGRAAKSKFGYRAMRHNSIMIGTLAGKDLPTICIKSVRNIDQNVRVFFSLRTESQAT